MELDLRTLERAFRAVYGISMKNYATSERIRFIQEAFNITPNIKLSALASELGYESDKAFLRFLAQHSVVRRRPNSVEITTSSMSNINAQTDSDATSQTLPTTKSADDLRLS